MSFIPFISSEYFSLRFVSGGVFHASSFSLPKIHFAAIPQSFFFFTKTIDNGNFPLKLHSEPFTLFTASVVGCNRVKKRQKIFQTGQKLSGLSFRIPIVVCNKRFTGGKVFAFLSKKISKSQKPCEFEVYTFIKNQKGAKQ